MPTAAQAAEEAARAAERSGGGGGYGEYFASFFLTDKEMGKRRTKAFN